MRIKLGIILGMSAFSVVACNYDLDDDFSDDVWEWDEDDSSESTLEERAIQTCDAFCVGLVECGVVEDSAFLSCREVCVEEYQEDESSVRSGCDCVAEASCDAIEARSCEDDPLPGVWLGGDDSPPASGGAGGGSPSAGGSDGSGASDGAGGSSSAGGSGAGGASGEPCVASCQCAEGEACEEGFCRAPMDPALMCDSDCDCTSGQACEAGFCE